ncbi:hypothetical protein EYF80_062446 [Liparis tanakae]|uniref:Uncharacterized protein n=1 Tax=Liparis tanakae TaxID=230148 RepID=A0A4Z2EFD8_9TELE|nr:hypothetical protein EYF80_062446 [Liparis tanakae]
MQLHDMRRSRSSSEGLGAPGQVVLCLGAPRGHYAPPHTQRWEEQDLSPPPVTPPPPPPAPPQPELLIERLCVKPADG